LFEPIFGPCVQSQRLTPATDDTWSTGSVALGGDADGDGLGDLVLTGLGDPAREARGRVAVVSTADGTPLLELEGERPAERLGFGFQTTNADLGPDIDGDGRADLVVSAANVLFDVFVSEGEAPHPGRVEVWSVAGGTQLHRWEGASDNCSLGHSIASLPDVDGDGRGDVLIVEGGCVEYREVDGETDAWNRSEDGIFVRSGATGEVIWSRHPDDEVGTLLGGSRGVWVLRVLDEPRLVYEQQHYAFFEIPPAVVHLDLMGNVASEWIQDGMSPLSRIDPWAVGADLDGDGEPDAVGAARAPDMGLILYPSVRRPVGALVSYSDCEAAHYVVPDVDADGLHDVFVGCAADGPALRLVNGRTGREIWSRTLDEAMGAWHVAEPRDIDGDGCVDLAAFQPMTAAVEIVRCAGR